MGQNCCTPGAEDAEVNVVAAPQVSSSAPPAQQTQAMSKSPKPAAARAAAPAGKGGLSFDLVLEDLDKAEELAYGSAFAEFGATNGSVGMDSAALRDFVASNSAVPYAEIDEALIKAGNEEMQITQQGFLQLLRQSAINEGVIIERFMGLASDGGESINAADCRTGLLMIKDELGATANALGDGRVEAVIDSVMRNAEPTVNLEGWTTFCQKLARIIRVTHSAKL